MIAEQDYCQYIISKCVTKDSSPATDGAFRTTKAFLDAYESSSSFYGSVSAKNRKLVEWVSFTIDQEAQQIGLLESDAMTVLTRCQKKIADAETYDDVFTAVSDFLWVVASKKAAKGSHFSLTDDSLLERKYATEWIAELGKKIEEARYDLRCMEEADNLPLGKQIFLGLVENPDGAWYANRENISYDDFKQQIKDCRRYLEESQFLYYVFTVTVIYREDLRSRYR